MVRIAVTEKMTITESDVQYMQSQGFFVIRENGKITEFVNIRDGGRHEQS